MNLVIYDSEHERAFVVYTKEQRNTIFSLLHFVNISHVSDVCAVC